MRLSVVGTRRLAGHLLLAVGVSAGVVAVAGQTQTGSGGSAPGTPVAAAACTRESLSALNDRYFAALTARDPSRLALAPTVKFTENGKGLQVGDGLWRTAGKVTFQRNLLDHERCGLLTMAVLEEEGGGPIIFGVRLRQAGTSLAEIESYIARSTEFFQTPAGVPAMQSDWDTILPPEERSTRAVMEAAADAYFNYFDDPKTAVPLGTPCDRWENGFRTTKGDCANLGPAGRGGLKMTHRRYPVSDLERGITAGFILFGNRLLDFHMFKIRNGRIVLMQALVGPASSTTGWEEQER